MVALSFPIHSARRLRAGQDGAPVLAPGYSCAGVFHAVTRQTRLPKGGAEEGMLWVLRYRRMSDEEPV